MSTFRSTRWQVWLSLSSLALLLVISVTAPPISARQAQITTTPTATPTTPQEYLSSVIDIVQTYALNSDQIKDWPRLRRQVMALGAQATTTAETYPAIRFVLSQLKDHHSFLIEPETAKLLVKTDAGVSDRFKPPTGKRLDGNLGYIKLPAISIANDIDAYVDAAHVLFTDITQTPVCGWVVDAREDEGGNLMPMVAAVGPLLGDGIFGTLIDKQDQRSSWYYRKGAVMWEDVVVLQTTPPALSQDYSTIPVAVLTSPLTGSAGEMLVLAFNGRVNTRRFGFPTAGISTSNIVIHLSDGAAIALTAGHAADRNGQIFTEPIPPDVKVAPFTGTLALDAATAWLKEKCKAA